ncbi:hypothetical protein GQ457_08G004050 [Hibiscus cannabinus]
MSASSHSRRNWSDLPCDILEVITGRMRWVDRIRIRAVCKAWSLFPSSHIPPHGDDTLPWVMKFRWSPPNRDSPVHGECLLLDPISGDYVVEEDINCHIFFDAIPCASSYGWVLFFGTRRRFFLYSPFTTEVLLLPEFGQHLSLTYNIPVATFSLNATSPKCVIFVLSYKDGKIHVMLCSPGDSSWKTYEFDGFGPDDFPVDATYANGVYYCVFRRGQLGAFNLQHKEWTLLVEHNLPRFYFPFAKLFWSGAHLQLLSCSRHSNLVKLDLSNKRWVLDKDLNGRVLFIGCTSFSVPAAGETSQLANVIISSTAFRVHPALRWYGCKLPSRPPLIYRYVAYKDIRGEDSEGRIWIEVPLGGIWRANDLIHTV